MTIRWFTDADRQDLRDAEEGRRVLAELNLRHTRWITDRPDVPAEHMLPIDHLRIDPDRRR
ncbi:hypothetical protein SAMN05660690_2183 [Geodermatophilus telluris]|uniref:Uncharacterized protein n=1 Tax=Geodermatophilus telluris TaxID=1190417 RepID=A0A1G6NS55_9ACTN|nr:hypothetical protein [Geodermatophilus telluris]SDC70015.1 hypothetical protein SAMN05660690_2183 [Geodermatophilus telluris]